MTQPIYPNLPSTAGQHEGGNLYNPAVLTGHVLKRMEATPALIKRTWNDFQKPEERKQSLLKVTIPSIITTSDDEYAEAQKLNTGARQLDKDCYQKAEFTVRVEELTRSDEAVLRDHIPIATDRLLEVIDKDVMRAFDLVPVRVGVTAEAAHTCMLKGLTALRKARISGSNLNFGVTPELEELLIQSPIYQGSGTNSEYSLKEGELDKRYGITPFRHADAKMSRVSGSLPLASAADRTGVVSGNYKVSSTQLSITGLGAVSSTLKLGDSFTIAGQVSSFAVTQDANVDVSGNVTISFWPPLDTNAEDGDAIAFDGTPIAGQTEYDMFPMYERRAVAFAPLEFATVDPALGVRQFSNTYRGVPLFVRTTIEYVSVGKGSVKVKLDAEYGFKLMNPSHAVCVCMPKGTV